MEKLKRATAATAACLLLGGGLGAATPTVANAAAFECSQGKVSDTRAYGKCKGKGKWRLAVSCTWGWSGKTDMIRQDGGETRRELKCGRGSIRSVWIETK